MTSISPQAMSERVNSCDSVPIMYFNLAVCNHSDNNVYCFYEGYDAPYYNVRISSLTDKQVIPIDSKGKTNVIRAYNYLKANNYINNYKMLFFVDRDYVNNSGLDDRIFVTDGYSVENYYTTDEAFSNILINFFHIAYNTDNYRRTIDHIHNELSIFISSSSTFLSWYRALRIKNPSATAQLSQSIPKCFVSTDNGCITRKDYSLKDIKEMFPEADDITVAEIQEQQSIVSNQLEIRGKYMFQFLEYILKKLQSDSKGAHFFVEVKNKSDINRKYFIQNYSSYASTPQRLKTYIKNNA